MKEMSYDPSTIKLMLVVLDDAWQGLVPRQREFTPKSLLAQRILERVAQGERDPARLKSFALLRPVASEISAPRS